MNRIIKRALWGTLLAGGITLAGAAAANAAEAPPNGADCGCNVVKSTLTTVTNLLTGPCDQTSSGGQQGSGGAEGGGGLPAVTQDVSDLVTDTLTTATSAVPGGAPSGGTPGGGTDPGVPSAPVDGVLDTVSGIASTTTSDVANAVSGVTGGLPDLPSVPSLPDTGAPGGGTPGSVPGVVTIPVPEVGTVHAGVTPDGVDVGKNLNVLGVKDVWDLTAGRNGVATTDRIGTDATNVLVDAALPTNGTTAPHASVTLPTLGGLTGGGLPGTGGGSLPGLPSLPLGDLTGTLGGLTGTLGGLTGSLSGLPSVPGLPGESVPGLPGTGGTPGGNTGVITIQIPGVGTVHAGTTPAGLTVGKNLDVLGVKDVWDLTAGRNGVATTDRIGTDATNVLVDAAIPTTGTTAPHASVTLPNLGGLTGGLPGLPGLPGTGGTPGGNGGGTIPGLPSLPLGDLGGTLGGVTGSLPATLTGALGGVTGSRAGALSGITGALPGLPTVPGTGTGTPGTGTGTPGTDPTGCACTGGTSLVSHLTRGLNDAARTLRVASSKNGSLAETGFHDPFLLISGVLLLAGGALVKALERR